jgi:hypothetical protein
MSRIIDVREAVGMDAEVLRQAALREPAPTPGAAARRRPVT